MHMQLAVFMRKLILFSDGYLTIRLRTKYMKVSGEVIPLNPLCDMTLTILLSDNRCGLKCKKRDS